MSGLLRHYPVTDRELAAYLGTAQRVARRFAAQVRAPDPDGYLSAAHFALTRALQTYQPGRGTSFRTWLFTRLRGELLHEHRAQSGFDRRSYEAVGAGLRGIEGLPRRPLSLDEMLQGEDGRGGLRLDLVDHVGDPWPKALERLWLATAMEQLPPRLRRVLEFYFLHELPQHEVGARLGVSQMQVSRLVRKALRELRQVVAEGRAEGGMAGGSGEREMGSYPDPAGFDSRARIGAGGTAGAAAGNGPG